LSKVIATVAAIQKRLMLQPVDMDSSFGARIYSLSVLSITTARFGKDSSPTAYPSSFTLHVCHLRV
jgi:hypothetical protein